MCLNVLPEGMSVHHECAVPVATRRGRWILDSCGSPYGCSELNLDPLEKHPVLSTTEPSLQLLEVPFKGYALN